MKKLILLVAVIALAALAVYALVSRGVKVVWDKDAVASSAARPWPGGLGTIETVAARFPPREPHEAAVKLAALAKQFSKSEIVEQYVSAEVARGELTIGEPPALPDVTPVRELLLREQIVWGRPGGIGEIGDQETSDRRVAQMTLGRWLVAGALAKARRGDAAAWEDLRAAWTLVRSMDRQPQVMEQTAALSIARMINAAAWKMPLSPPDWFAELQRYDPVLRLIEAFQYQVASYANGGSPMFPTKWHAAAVEHDHRIAEAVFKEKRCDATIEMNDLGVDLSSVWRRAFRYRAEREATANALRLREGKPIESESACSGSGWSLNGLTLRFSAEIPTAPPDRPMPLVLRVEAPAAKP
jgi:hypothetical protein